MLAKKKKKKCYFEGFNIACYFISELTKCGMVPQQLQPQNSSGSG